MNVDDPPQVASGSTSTIPPRWVYIRLGPEYFTELSAQYKPLSWVMDETNG